MKDLPTAVAVLNGSVVMVMCTLARVKTGTKGGKEGFLKSGMSQELGLGSSCRLALKTEHLPVAEWGGGR